MAPRNFRQFSLIQDHNECIKCQVREESGNLIVKLSEETSWDKEISDKVGVKFRPVLFPVSLSARTEESASGILLRFLAR